MVRSGRDVDQLALPVEKIVQSIRDLPVSDVLTMDQLLGKSDGRRELRRDAAGGLCGGVVAAGRGWASSACSLTSWRSGRREIGIRIALGAQREQVMRMMLLDGLRPALLWLVLGLAGSVGAVEGIASMLYETEPLDPAVFAAVSALLLVAAMACVVPAWRASRLDPMQALRTE